MWDKVEVYLHPPQKSTTPAQPPVVTPSPAGDGDSSSSFSVFDLDDVSDHTGSGSEVWVFTACRTGRVLFKGTHAGFYDFCSQSRWESTRDYVADLESADDAFESGQESESESGEEPSPSPPQAPVSAPPVSTFPPPSPSLTSPLAPATTQPSQPSRPPP